MARRFRNILVIQLGDIGDVVLATPTFRAFKETYPDARLSVLVRKGYGCLLAGDPHISEVLEVVKSRSKLHGGRRQLPAGGRLRTRRGTTSCSTCERGTGGRSWRSLRRAPEKVSFARRRRLLAPLRLHPPDPAGRTPVTPPPRTPGRTSPSGSSPRIGVGTADSRPKLYVTEEAARTVDRLLAGEGLAPGRPIRHGEPVLPVEVQGVGVREVGRGARLDP